MKITSIKYIQPKRRTVKAVPAVVQMAIKAGLVGTPTFAASLYLTEGIKRLKTLITQIKE